MNNINVTDGAICQDKYSGTSLVRTKWDQVPVSYTHLDVYKRQIVVLSYMVRPSYIRAKSDNIIKLC